ncbi:hypothetical protein GGF32_008821 [Allomyces javanicus]|nr:hypothetical protein GGF32_008821 [Allomyces javanicus]
MWSRIRPAARALGLLNHVHLVHGTSRAAVGPAPLTQLATVFPLRNLSTRSNPAQAGIIPPRAPTAAATAAAPVELPLAAAKKKTTVRRAGTPAAMPSAESWATTVDSTAPVMHAMAVCTATEYNLDAVRARLVQGWTELPTLASDVLHLHAAVPADDGHVEGEVFVFSYGVFVAWGSEPKRVAAAFMTKVLGRPVTLTPAPARAIALGGTGYAATVPLDGEKRARGQPEVMPYQRPEVEEMDYIEDPNEATGLTGDTILIGSSPEPALSKLAFSHGISRSAKVAVLENLLDTYLGSTRHVPSQLASGHALGMSRPQVLQKIGQLLSVRALLNLSGSANAESLLDTPEYYWSKPQLEEYYNNVSRWLDIKPRIAVLNQKLDYAAEFAEVLRGHLSEQHSLKLEWFIIILIAVAVAFECLHWAEKLHVLNFERFKAPRLRKREERDKAHFAASSDGTPRVAQ